MTKYTFLAILLLVAAMPATAQTKTNAQESKKIETPISSAKNAEENASRSLNWYAIGEVLELSAKSPKKIFVDVYTNWCGWCKVMDKQTFSDPKVADYLNKNFYPVKFDAEQKTPVTFGGTTYNFKSEYKSNELAVALLQGRMSYPSTVYLDEKGQLLTVVPGFQKPESFLPILVFFAENYYLSTTWEDFNKEVWPIKQKEFDNK